uniref:Type III-B CRISPR module RAMP protein Cmr6 n=1 Tax=Geoglobus ahangari TaxID=113653 RepID=A0A7C3UJP5_9EURY
MMGRKQQERRSPSPTLPLPPEVRQVAGNGDRCDNIGLWLDRFLTVNPQNWEITQDAKHRRRLMQLTNKQEWQRQVREQLNALQKRYEAMLKWYEQRGFAVKLIQAKPVWRFVVGLGAAHVLETSITLHRIFGFPIIPGSALKGATRAYTQLVEGKTEDDPELIAIFGTTEQAGSVIFLDAIPLEVPKFQLDIMNPHYPNYYSTKGQNPPADWDSPRPVFFLTVGETPYRFAIAARSEQDNRLLELVEEWLKGALRELGIGAKTSADYGYWNVQ